MPIPQSLKSKFEAFFDYRWKNDKNYAFNGEEAEALLSQLPVEQREKIYKDYMFSDFLKKFNRTFEFPNYDSRNKHAYYTWYNEPYANFMFDVLSFLEPRKEEKNEIIIDENEEVSEVIFFVTGTLAVGFELNKVKKFVIKFKDATVINAYGCTFNERSEYAYKALTQCEGYSIRRKNWKHMFTHEQIADELKD